MSGLLITVLVSLAATTSALRIVGLTTPQYQQQQQSHHFISHKLAATQLSMSSTPNDNVNDFSASVPSPAAIDAEDSSEDATSSIDFDKLAEESAQRAFQPKTDLSDLYVKDDRKAPREAQWFPMLLSPAALDGSFAGDVGFDPFGFAKDKESMYRMREAEIKHSRLAMLAAAGWPMSELWHKEIADTLGLESILAGEGRAPSVLNGGLDNSWIIGAFAIVLAIGGALEFTTFKAAESNSKYRPGELGFDPLRLYSFRSSFGLDTITERLTREEKIARAKFDMELSEIKHGRLAMLAITGYAAQEFLFQEPVVLQTPFFFGDPIL